MKAGISFEFIHENGLNLATSVMAFLFANRYARGEIEILEAQKTLGIAGRLDKAVIESIPKGAYLSIISDLDDAEIVLLRAEISDMNASVDADSRVFSIVEYVP